MKLQTPTSEGSFRRDAEARNNALLGHFDQGQRTVNSIMFSNFGTYNALTYKVMGHWAGARFSKTERPEKVILQLHFMGLSLFICKINTQM